MVGVLTLEPNQNTAYGIGGDQTPFTCACRYNIIIIGGYNTSTSSSSSLQHLIGCSRTNGKRKLNFVEVK